MWWIWLATAKAASFPTEHLDELVTEVQAQVEGVAGRRFTRQPTWEITVTPIASQRIVDAFNEENPRLGASERADIEVVVRAQDVQGWGSAEPLARAFAARMGLDASKATNGPVSPDFLLTDAATAAAMPPTRALAGLMSSFRTNTRRSTAMSFLFDNAAAAALLVRQRREVLREMAIGTVIFTTARFYEDRIHTLMPLAASARPAGVTESVDARRKVGGNEWYDEIWAARGPQVVGVTWEGRAPGSTLARAVADVFALGLPTAAPPLESNAEALARLEKYAPPPGQPE